MLKPVYLRSFDGELKKAKKRGYDMEKIKDVMDKLIDEKPLNPKHRNHKLKGDFAQRHTNPLNPNGVYRIFT